MKGIRGSGKIIVLCPCGNHFIGDTFKVKQGKNKYCSLSCKYKYRVMPKKYSQYNKTKENPTKFKKGHIAWNNGFRGSGICKPNNGSIKKGERRGINTEFKKGGNTDIANAKWKGNEVGYCSLHTWVKRKNGKADICEKCGSKNHVEWANKSHDYKREIEDWIKLCKKCHVKYDRDSNKWGYASKKFNLSSKNK